MKIIESCWPAISLAGLLGVWGLNWGLPGPERTKLFLRPELQNAAFYEKVSQARDDYYTQIGINPMAHVGRRTREGKSYEESHNILSSYSSFLVRTHHGDEQANLVMLSHLNPLKGRWYPYTFGYGGAYIYPLAVYLGVLHVLHVIHLVPQATYYYAHPEEIAKVFLASRGWAVIGLLLSMVPLFFWVRRLGGARLALWTTCLYALLPATLGTAKMAKPHTWAAGWVFATLMFCLRSKDEEGYRSIALAGVCYGLALGTTMSQSCFFPILIWACWTPSWKTSCQRAVVVGALSAATFCLTNFYLFAHLQDFRDEIFFYSHASPFGFRWGAFWELWSLCVRPSFGTVMWVALSLCTLWALVQKENRRLKELAILCVFIFIYVTCQVQSQNGDAISNPFFLAWMGIGCLFIATVIQKLPRSSWLMTAALMLLLGNAILYNLHFASDRAPRDNASLAALWITQNIPAGETITHCEVIPHVIDFPPLDFDRYKIIPFSDPQFKSTAPMYAILPDWGRKTWQKNLIEQHFVLVKRFAESPLQKLGHDDPFTTADFALDLYRRGS